MTPFDDEDIDAFDEDIEPGQGVIVPAPHPFFVSFCSMLVISLFFVSYGSEYFQEMHEIAALKLATPFTDACLEGATAESFSWFHRLIYHSSGLQDITERECWNQRRVASMLQFPNPLIVFCNLFWKAAVGTSPLADLFNRQSYLIQCVLIVSASIVVGLIVYNFALKLPAFFTRLVQLPDLHRREQFEEVQQRIREEAMGLPPAARATYKRARDARKQQHRDWKLATYSLFMQQHKAKNI